MSAILIYPWSGEACILITLRARSLEFASQGLSRSGEEMSQPLLKCVHDWIAYSYFVYRWIFSESSILMGGGGKTHGRLRFGQRLLGSPEDQHCCRLCARRDVRGQTFASNSVKNNYLNTVDF